MKQYITVSEINAGTARAKSISRSFDSKVNAVAARDAAHWEEVGRRGGTVYSSLSEDAQAAVSAIG